MKQVRMRGWQLMLLGCIAAAGVASAMPHDFAEAVTGSATSSTNGVWSSKVKEVVASYQKLTEQMKSLKNLSPADLSVRSLFKKQLKPEATTRQSDSTGDRVFWEKMFPGRLPGNSLRQVGGDEYPWTCVAFTTMIDEAKTNLTAAGGSDSNDCLTPLKDLYCTMVAGGSGCDRTFSEKVSPFNSLFEFLKAMEGGGSPAFDLTEAQTKKFCDTTSAGCGSDSFFAKAKQFENDYFGPGFGEGVTTCMAFFENTMGFDEGTRGFLKEKLADIALTTTMACTKDGSNHCSDEFGPTVMETYTLLSEIGDATITEAQEAKLKTTCGKADCAQKIAAGLDTAMFVLEELIPEEEEADVKGFLGLLLAPAFYLDMMCITDPTDDNRFCIKPFQEFSKSQEPCGDDCPFDTKICSDMCVQSMMVKFLIMGLESGVMLGAMTEAEMDAALNELSLQLNAYCAPSADGGYCGSKLETKGQTWAAVAQKCNGPSDPFDDIPSGFGSACSDDCKDAATTFMGNEGFGCCAGSLIITTPDAFQEKMVKQLQQCSVPLGEACSDSFVVQFPFEVENLKYSEFNTIWNKYEDAVRKAVASYFKLVKSQVVVTLKEGPGAGTTFVFTFKFSSQKAFDNFMTLVEKEAAERRQATGAVDISANMAFLSTVPKTAKVDTSKDMTVKGSASSVKAAKTKDPSKKITESDMVAANSLKGSTAPAPASGANLNQPLLWLAALLAPLCLRMQH